MCNTIYIFEDAIIRVVSKYDLKNGPIKSGKNILQHNT